MNKLMTSLLVANSVLVGVMFFALCCAASVLAYVVDQHVGLSAVPVATQWAFDYRPKDLPGMLSFSVAVTATCLFMSLALRDRGEIPAASSVCLAFLVFAGLVAATCFFSFVAAVLLSQIRIYGDMWPAGSPVPSHYPQHLHEPSIDSRLWLLVAGSYSLVLWFVGVRIHRRREAINSVQRTRADARAADL